MSVALQLFSERGIEAVSMPEIALASDVGRATLYRYFPSKFDLVVALGTWTWETYITAHNASLPAGTLERMTGAEYLKFYLDSFIDLYRNHGDILRFNYDFNSYLRYETGTSEQRQSYMDMLGQLHEGFHELYGRGMCDGTLNPNISEESMFSCSFHIMLAAATRYAIGLVYVSEEVNPENELAVLEELLLSRFVNK